MTEIILHMKLQELSAYLRNMAAYLLEKCIIH